MKGTFITPYPRIQKKKKKFNSKLSELKNDNTLKQ